MSVAPRRSWPNATKSLPLPQRKNRPYAGFCDQWPTSLNVRHHKTNKDVFDPVPRCHKTENVTYLWAYPRRKKIPVVVRDVPQKQYANFFDPAVASHCAAVLVENLVDAQKAARELQPALLPHEIAAFAHQMKNSPEVQAVLQTDLEKFGLTDDAKKKFFGTLWALALDSSPQNTQKQIAALRLLARCFGLGENVQKQEKPETLRIADFSEGIIRMGLMPEVLASVPPQVSEFSADEEDLDDEQA